MSGEHNDAPRTADAPATPRISVAMCTFNGESYLREQIESILRQSVAVDEIVVADDASTDGTRQMLEDYARRLPQLFRLCLRDTNVGTIRNVEFALQQCRGEIIFLADQDDVWRPDKVATMLARFRDPRCLLLFSDGRLVDPAGRPLGSTLWQKWQFTRWRRFLWRWIAGAAAFDLVFNNNKVTGATVAMRRSLLVHALAIRVPHGYWHDGWFAMHAAANRGLAFIPDELIDYRIHPKQQVGLQQQVATKNDSEISFADFYRGFESQYPACATMVRALGFASRAIAKLSPRS